MMISIDAKLDPHDIWIGVFWKYYSGLLPYDSYRLLHYTRLKLYICIIPMLCFMVTIEREIMK